MKVILIGFMGSGKSTAGSALAKALQFDFIEMDSLILTRTNYDSIAQIFSEQGEQYFREQETLVSESLSDRERVVISTGGGTPCRDENMRALMQGDAFSVYLSIPFAVAQARVGDARTRPLWQNIDKTRELFEYRDPIYRKHSDIIVNADQDISQIVDEIENALKNGRYLS